MDSGDGVEPLFLQAKEAQPSVLAPYCGRSQYANQGERVVTGQHLMQAESDIFLGWTRVPGPDKVDRDFYIRQLKDWKFSAPIERALPSGRPIRRAGSTAGPAYGPARCWPGRPGISARPAHPAIVSEQDYITAQDTSAPRVPAGPATRRYLLAGLLRCGTCGRRLESAWSNGKPAYRCRHGYTSATRPDPGRPKNPCVREDQLLPPLAALAIPHAGDHDTPHGSRKVTASGETADLIDHLRTADVTLTYDPATRTLRTDTEDAIAVTTGHAR